MMHPALPLIPLLAVAVLAVGCGSSGSTPPPSSDPAIAAAVSAGTAVNAAVNAAPAGTKLSKPAYIRRADAVCRRMISISRHATVEFERAKKAGQPLVAADVLDRYLAAYTGRLAELHSLRQPRRARKALTLLLQLVDNQAQVTPAQAAALRSNSLDAVNQIAHVRKQATRQAGLLGDQYGFKACGRAVLTAG